MQRTRPDQAVQMLRRAIIGGPQLDYNIYSSLSARCASGPTSSSTWGSSEPGGSSREIDASRLARLTDRKVRLSTKRDETWSPDIMPLIADLFGQDGARRLPSRCWPPGGWRLRICSDPKAWVRWNTPMP